MERGVQAYKQPLPEGVTLAAFSGSEMIFKNGGAWLNPLFALESFLSTWEGDRSNLALHDTAAGKAAAILMARMGVGRVHINVISDLAVEVYNHYGIEASWERKIERLACKTEELLSTMTDEDEMYRLLKRRAKLVRGVAVSVTDLSFSFPGGKTIFDTLSFDVEEGGQLIIQGDNGMGKTTLLNLLMGDLKPSSGSILIDNTPPLELPQRTIGYIKQQQTQQQFAVSGREVVAMGVDPSLSSSQRTWEVDNALRRVGAYALAKRNFFTLSGGERQRISIARTLCQRARLLLLDEPTSFLDTTAREAFVEMVHSLSTAEMPTIIIVTHDHHLAKQLQWPTLILGDSHE
jgi:ABC-type Mn2+/Zn2+ transport system ATPase subunit